MSRLSETVWRGSLAVGAAACAAFFSFAANAQSLESALVQSYQSNPQLNSQRAAVRVVDEGVPQALAGYRPKVTATGTIGEQYARSRTKLTTPGANPYLDLSGIFTPSAYGVTTTQTLFNGFQTANRTRQAESQVMAARETLRTSEQTVLLSAVTAYMNLLRDTAILDLQKRNVEVLQEQLRQIRDRFNVGEVTRTDVAQSEFSHRCGALAGIDRRSQLQNLRCGLPAGDRQRRRETDCRHAG